jgi:hypothetical protein
MQTRCNTCLKEFQDSDIVCGYEHYDFDNKYRPDGLQKPNSVHLIHEHCLGKQAPNTQPCPSCNKKYDFYCGAGRYSEMNSQLHETFPELFEDVEIVKKGSPKKTIFVVDLDSDSDSDGKAKGKGKGRSFRHSKTRGFSFKKKNKKGMKRSKKNKMTRGTGKRITGKRITGKRITGKRITGKRITGKRITGKRITGKRRARIHKLKSW